MKITMNPIGYVDNEVDEKKHETWGSDISKIILKKEYSGGLVGLNDFSHAIIICYLDKSKFDIDKNLQRRPQNREDMPLIGIFSQRGKCRPNHIGVTSVEIVSVEDTTLVVKGLDALNGTPILDIKPYFPVFDCREKAVVPEWVDRLMDHYF